MYRLVINDIKMIMLLFQAGLNSGMHHVTQVF